MAAAGGPVGKAIVAGVREREIGKQTTYGELIAQGPHARKRMEELEQEMGV